MSRLDPRDAQRIRERLFGPPVLEYWRGPGGETFAVELSDPKDGVDYPVIRVCGPIPPGEATIGRLIQAERHSEPIPWSGLSGWTMHWEMAVNALTGAWQPEVDDPEDRVIGYADLRRFLEDKVKVETREITP
jgi:hypothetical protein